MQKKFDPKVFQLAKAWRFSSLMDPSIEESRAMTAKRTPTKSSNRPRRPSISISL